MTNKEQIETYKTATQYAKKHINNLENYLANRDHLIETLINREVEFRVDELNQDKRLVTRKVYQDVYEHIMEDGSRYRFLSMCPSEYLTQKEQEEWFDEHHDRYITSGDHIANSDYQDLMNYELSTLPATRKDDAEGAAAGTDLEVEHAY